MAGAEAVRRGRRRVWQQVWSVLLLALFVGGCAALPDAGEVGQLLGLERGVPHYDVPSPPTPGAYTMQLAMEQTRRVVVHARPGAAAYEVTDPQVIRAVIAVLRAGERAVAPAGAAPLREPLLLDFVAGASERTVTAHYNPRTQTLLLFNVPNTAWPDHAVGTYHVPPAFGAALLAALAGSGSAAGP